ncbi:MAG: hypothetical protein WBR35_18845 [Anaerolineae bacterium]
MNSGFGGLEFCAEVAAGFHRNSGFGGLEFCAEVTAGFCRRGT